VNWNLKLGRNVPLPKVGEEVEIDGQTAVVIEVSIDSYSGVPTMRAQLKSSWLERVTVPKGTEASTPARRTETSGSNTPPTATTAESDSWELGSPSQKSRERTLDRYLTRDDSPSGAERPCRLVAHHPGSHLYSTETRRYGEAWEQWLYLDGINEPCGNDATVSY
jgi:hypothetical protein